MDDVRFGALARVLRVRRGWRQGDLGARAGLSRAAISLIERGHAASFSVAALRRVGRQLEMSVDLVARWRGGDAGRLLNAGHAALHETIARLLNSLDGWEHAPEVSFSIYGERGVIDILAFHPATGSLLVIELKTEVVDLEELLTVMDRRQRLALQIAAERGWRAREVSAWIVIADSDANRDRISRHRAAMRSAFPDDGHAVRRWLRSPSGRLLALSFWANSNGSSANQRFAPRLRVRRRPTRQTHGQ